MVGEVDYDVIVVGAGGAGLAGAVTAAQAGCSVLILEAESKIGGSTALSGGVFNAAGTSLQTALGLRDSIEDYYHDYMTLTQWRQPASLIRTFCEQATPTLEWLISLGVQIPARLSDKPKGVVWPAAPTGGGIYAAGLERVPRGHAPVGGGLHYIEVLDNHRAVLGAELVLNSRVEQLLIEDGRVVGVRVDGDAVRSHAVLLACGGIERDPEMLREWMPDSYDVLPPGATPDTYAPPGSRGDALRLGRQAGAEIIGVNCGLLSSGFYLPSAKSRGLIGNQPTSLIYVNGAGRRFADETASYAVMPGLMKQQGFHVWGIFDEAARLRADPTASGVKQGWDPQLVLDCVEAGDIKSAGSIEDLARALGMVPQALKTATEQYNEDLMAGVDRWFLRDLHGLHPIAQPPFYAFEYRASVIVTGAGPRIDAGAHVIDEGGRIVPGLFAAGECGAGVLSERYVGGGNGVANALTMGRVAAMSMVREIKERR
jgi:succinate dehydrogenase/fumarate reductase flavoprotein subunit